MKKILMIVFAFFVFLLKYSSVCGETNYYSLQVIDNLSKMNLTNIDNVMFVAHPDDETLFGGAHIIENNSYLVVCVTCGTDIVRVKEFSSLMEAFGVKYMMLGYTDLNKQNKIDFWDTNLRNSISANIMSIINYKNWKSIVVHNPDGDYGHVHHKLVSNMVTYSSKKNENIRKLIYFGKYYPYKYNYKDYGLKRISDYLLNLKSNYIYGYYLSQISVCRNIDYLIPYENWLSESEWNKNYKTIWNDELNIYQI